MPRLLDLFCCAGGASAGYAEAGFQVTGVDIKPQPRYPFDFIQADALEILADRSFLERFDAVAASPPCQAYCAFRYPNGERGHPELIEPVRRRLREWGGLYVIENVVPAPLDGVMLCGSSFGLGVRRHRVFESNVLLLGVGCNHRPEDENVPVYGLVDDRGRAKRSKKVLAAAAAAMGIDWMTHAELEEAIPPAYTRFLGEQLLAHLPVGAV